MVAHAWFGLHGGAAPEQAHHALPSPHRMLGREEKTEAHTQCNSPSVALPVSRKWPACQRQHP